MLRQNSVPNRFVHILYTCHVVDLLTIIERRDFDMHGMHAHQWQWSFMQTPRSIVQLVVLGPMYFHFVTQPEIKRTEGTNTRARAGGGCSGPTSR